MRNLLHLIFVERTKEGLPALWESGGGYTNTGKATIVAGPNGEKKAPLYIRQRGPLACAHHALFVVHEGDTVIKSSHVREDFNHKVYRIVAIRGDEAALELIAEFSHGQWTGPLGQKLEADLARMAAGEPPMMELSIAVQMAEGKATDYHCRKAYYCKIK